MPLLWLTVASRYNHAFVTVADALPPAEPTIKALGNHILISHWRLAEPVSVDGFTLQFGLVLLTVLVLAAVNVPTIPRLAWLAGMWCGMFIMHVVGIAALAGGVGWSLNSTGEGPGEIVFKLFAVFWGLVPAIIGGLWSFLYWIPRAGKSSADNADASSLEDDKNGAKPDGA